MNAELDTTHDPALRSWVASAHVADCDFPIQNLPLGVFSHGAGQPRIGVAIGDQVLDLARAQSQRLLDELPTALREACAAQNLDPLAALGRPMLKALRQRLCTLLRLGDDHASRTAECLVPLDAVDMKVSTSVPNFSDFLTSIHHARNAGNIFRPGAPLMPNFLTLPIAYHGRASSVAVSGTPVRRPRGQTGSSDAASAVFGPSRALDMEVELACWVGTGTALGDDVALAQAPNHMLGLGLLNDWSARDFQAWEALPLGPFLSKSFLTTVSPWVITLDALAPFHCAAVVRGDEAPPLLDHLNDTQDRARGGLDIAIDVQFSSAAMRAQRMAPICISRPNFSTQYWTVFQMLAHQASNGCNLVPGDLLGSGTISGPGRNELGCLLEMTENGRRPLELSNGEHRNYLHDGDEVILTARCERDGFVGIGFGECRGRVVPAHGKETP
ncbi:MAG: fumarylacetoacetase [Pseudomonadota bacterium]